MPRRGCGGGAGGAPTTVPSPPWPSSLRARPSCQPPRTALCACGTARWGRVFCMCGCACGCVCEGDGKHPSSAVCTPCTGLCVARHLFVNPTGVCCGVLACGMVTWGRTSVLASAPTLLHDTCLTVEVVALCCFMCMCRVSRGGCWGHWTPTHATTPTSLTGGCDMRPRVRF